MQVLQMCITALCVQVNAGMCMTCVQVYSNNVHILALTYLPLKTDIENLFNLATKQYTYIGIY